MFLTDTYLNTGHFQLRLYNAFPNWGFFLASGYGQPIKITSNEIAKTPKLENRKRITKRKKYISKL
jgi:hypothetical protein